MKPIELTAGTKRKLAEHAPVQKAEVDGEVVYRMRTRCTSCQEEVILESAEEPRVDARAIAGGLLPRVVRGFVCDRCALELEAAEKRAEVEARMKERVADSRLPAGMQGFDWAEMLIEEGRAEVIAAAKAWAVDPEAKGLCLFGDVGRGKTRLAATAAWHRLQTRSIRWVSMPVLLAHLGAAFGDEDRKRAISVLTGTGALVLDDLDKVNPSEWAKNQLFAAIDTREQAGAPLLVTTNSPPSALGEKFGDPVMSRIVGYCDVYELPGTDNRLRFEFDAKEVRE